MDGLDWNEWVAVKRAAFGQTVPQTRLDFNVIWNEVEARLSIGCQEVEASPDHEPSKWSGLFSIDDVIYIHEQLALVVPSLAPYRPTLPRPAKNLWGHMASVHVPPSLCTSLESYLRTAQDLCGRALVVSVLFESGGDEAYLEDMGDLRKQGYEEMYTRAQEELQSVLAMRPDAENMLHMATVYALEDEVVTNVSIALAELYNFQLQPFLDLRELACGKLRCTRAHLEQEDDGSKESMLQQYVEWQDQQVKAIDRIRELYVEYYQTTTELVTGQLDRMMEDQKRFGRSTFEVGGLSRLYRLQQFVHEERLRCLRARRLQQEHERDKAEQKLMTASGSVAVEHIETEVYDYQISVLDLRLAILQEEELLLRHHLTAFAQRAYNDSGMFYDAPESREDANSFEDSNYGEDPKITALKDKLAILFRKRAALRSRKAACTAAKAQKRQQRKSTEQQEQKHHALQKKREERARQDALRKAKVEEDRKNTVDRLRTYRMRYPSPRVLKPRNHDAEPTVVNYQHTEEKPAEEKSLSSFVFPSDVDDKSACTKEPLSAVIPIPSLPLPPPPPPPPPPLLTPFKKNLSIVSPPSRLPQNNNDAAVGAPSLQDLLAARSRLRRTDVTSDAKTRELLRLRPGRGGGEEGGLEAVLLGALERIRHVTKDDSDETQDSDFD